MIKDDQYHCIRKLGGGAFATAYLAVHEGVLYIYIYIYIFYI